MPEVLAEGLRFPEGPAFDRDGRLWAVELQGGALIRLDRTTLTRFDVGGAPNGIAFRDGVLWYCDAALDAVRSFDEDRGTRTIIGPEADEALDKPNDLAFDTLGNLVFTCPGNSREVPTGRVWCRRADGLLQMVASGLYFPNGLAFSPDGSELVIAETYRHRLWRGGWDAENATWVDARPWANVGGPIGPDGLAFDKRGDLHVAVFGQGRVARIERSGEIAATTEIPGRRPTNVAFDPSGGLGLVVTEAEKGQILALGTPCLGAALFDGLTREPER